MRYKTCQQAEANLNLSLGFQRRGSWHFKHFCFVLCIIVIFLYILMFNNLQLQDGAICIHVLSSQRLFCIFVVSIFFVFCMVACLYFCIFLCLTTFNCRTVLLAFINCLVISTPQLKERNRLRNEFIGKFCSLILA